MTIRQIINTVTVPAPGDPYATPTTFTQGQVLAVDVGGAWEAAIGTANMVTLSGPPLTDDQQGDGGTDATDNS